MQTDTNTPPAQHNNNNTGTTIMVPMTHQQWVALMQSQADALVPPTTLVHYNIAKQRWDALRGELDKLVQNAEALRRTLDAQQQQQHQGDPLRHSTGNPW